MAVGCHHAGDGLGGWGGSALHAAAAECAANMLLPMRLGSFELVLPRVLGCLDGKHIWGVSRPFQASASPAFATECFL